MSWDSHPAAREDLFAATRMSLGDHLEDLRLHLGRALLGFAAIVFLVFALDGLGFLTGWPVGVAKPVLDVIKKPVEDQLLAFYDRRAEAAARQLRRAMDDTPRRELSVEVEKNELLRAAAAPLGLPEPGPAEPGYVALRVYVTPYDWFQASREAQRLLGRRPALGALGVAETMVAYFKVAMACGLVLGSPWVFWQLWSFVAAGLYPHEKRLVNLYLPFSIALFVAGTLVCQFLVMPQSVAALLAFNEWLDVEPELRLSDWLGFAVLLPLVFGVAFQTPLVMWLLDRVGLIPESAYRGRRPLAWFLLAILAAVLTPTPDYVTLLYLWVPLGILYELGILLCRLSARPTSPPAEWSE